MSEDLVVIPLPTDSGTVTYAVAKLVTDRDGVFAEAIAAVPDTVFAPPRRIALSPRSLAQLKPGSSHRPGLYLYEGMILPPP
ncbi:MAG: hypothetical protein JO056_05950 [Alphaproteobacteria bacterium]|uniref:hypothetical protein n=1 Tax=Bradyrhizobium sp. TaxID=376 RepID=UPI001EC7F812|nr:hypothetical protein [Bradyrhizobium sp.]MBV9570765.1 hypothetical protein [Alphaproteobacteria bacterium]MBV9979017.1 hypothetical protein [Bradyrhizobium sp.]